MRAKDSYPDYSGRDDVPGGGTRMIAVSAPIGTWRVWTRRIGNSSDLEVTPSWPTGNAATG